MGGSSINYVMAVSRPPSASKWFLAGGVNAANCIAAYAPKGAASLAASYTNLANPGTYDATTTSAPTWSAANGWMFDGINQFVAQPVVFQQGYTFLIRFSNWVKEAIINTRDTVTGRFFYLLPNFGTPSKHYFQLGVGGRQFNAEPGISSGVLGIAGNTAKCYRDGNYEGVVSGPQWNAHPCYIACQNFNSTSTNTYSQVYVQAWAIYDIELTATQIGLISTAMAAL